MPEFPSIFPDQIHSNWVRAQTLLVRNYIGETKIDLIRQGSMESLEVVPGLAHRHSVILYFFDVALLDYKTIPPGIHVLDAFRVEHDLVRLSCV
jgi:hypothetical protein